jgi:two-component system sensor histidine kinase AtoS
MTAAFPARRFQLRPRSLQARFLVGTVLVLLVVMAGVIVVVEQRQRAAIVGEVLRRGEVIARDLAASSSGPLLLYNFTALEQNAARVSASDDVVYAMVLDAEGAVAAHSEDPGLVGTALAGPADRRAAGTEGLLVQETAPGPGSEAVYDFAVPVLVSAQKWGTVRVGLSRRRMEAQISRTRWELAGLSAATLLLGGLVAALVARRIARPVRQLAAGAEAISRGELDQRIAPSGFDEIGQLALAFNHMAAQLLQQRSDLETTHGELRRRFQELADLKSYTDSIFGSLTSGVVTLDLDGRLATLNPAAEMLTGLFAGEVTGRYATEVFAHTPEVGEILLETLSSRSGRANLSLTLRRLNGTTLPVEMSTAPLRGVEGKDLGVVGVFGDVTVVRELEAQLRRSDRLAALGTLAAGLAHEIKNPLTSLRTFTRLIPKKFDDARFRESFQEVVPRELERINGIVEELLELTRPSPLHLQPVVIPILLDRALELYTPQIETRRITVGREYARDVPAVSADADLLYRAFVNLVANALEAMDPGGRLTVRAGWHHGPDPFSAVSRAGLARRLRIEIEDTGSGISALDADKVFDPFFTTKASGTGLGLALTHKIVEDHGGVISFRSAPGRGTTFRILLPLAGERSRESGSA